MIVLCSREAAARRTRSHVAAGEVDKFVERSRASNKKFKKKH